MNGEPPLVAVRRLTRSDASAFRDVRLEALREHPDAFGADYDDERVRPAEDFAAMLEGGFVLSGGTGTAERIDGIAGVYLPSERKARHKAVLWGLYVRREARGRGLARRLIEGCIVHARTQAEELVLAVATHNAGATRLYRSIGFTPCGFESRALKTNGVYYDETLMSVRFAEH